MHIFNWLHRFDGLFDGSQVNIGVAFLAGVITFFASCLLPLVPTYLAYLSGVSLQHVEGNVDASDKRWRVIRVAGFFVLGFIATFVVLGIALNQAAALVAPYRDGINRVAGLLFIFMGLFMMGVFRHPWFTKERRFDVHGLMSKHQHLHALLVGVAFGFGWTPCIGPVLALILFWSAHQATMWYGTLLLIVYGLGLGLPFLVVAAGFEKIIPLLRKYAKATQYVTHFAALVIILIGFLLLLGQFQKVPMLSAF